jgi:hypothetical protein
MEGPNRKQTGVLAVGQPPHSHEYDNRYDHDLEVGRAEEGYHRSTTHPVTDEKGGDDSASSQHSSDGPTNANATPRRPRPGHDGSGGGSDSSPPVARVPTNVSLGPDNPVEHYTSYVEVPDAVYDRLPHRRRLVVVALLSYCSFLAPISSTTVLSATPEVAAEYGTTGSIVDLTNALYMLFMGVSPVVWGPFSEVWGRRTVSLKRCLLLFSVFCARRYDGEEDAPPPFLDSGCFGAGILAHRF